MESLRRTIGSTIAGLMASSFVQCHQRTLALPTLPVTLWHGRMEKFSQSLRTMASCMSMTWTVIFKDQSLTLPVLEQTTSRLFQLHLDMPFSSGPKIKTIQLVRATMESTHFNIFESIKAKIESSFQFSTTKSRMWSGRKTDNNLSSSRVNSQLWLRCTIWMVSQLLNSESNSETR